MKVAVATENGMVSEHFGFCECFTIFDTQDNNITGQTQVPNPGHKPGFLPNFLGDMGVEVIIAGGMGGGAVEIFNERNIEVIVGAKGDIEENVKKYLKGELISTGTICHEHSHEDECEG